MKRIYSVTSFTFSFLSFLALNSSSALLAATITVANTDDSGPGSLRKAIQSAAADDTINFSVGGTIALTSGELLVSRNLTIAGPGAASLAVSGSRSNRVFEISSSVTVNLSGFTIRDGHAPDGIPNGARGTNGGGIYNAGTLALTACAVSGNSAGNASMAFSLSGPVHAVGGVGGSGGGIYNIGTLTLTACTVSSNSAGTGGRGATTGGTGGEGGGIHNAGTLVLAGCTLNGNVAGTSSGSPLSNQQRATLGGDGGAVYNAGSLTITACTISANRAGIGGNGWIGGTGGNGGGIFTTSNSPLPRLQNTLVASNNVGFGGANNPFRGGRGPVGSGPDLFGAFTSQGHNLIGSPYPCTGFVNEVNGDITGPLDPMLGPLQDNGGPTLTMALLPGSPAIDAGDDALLNPPFNLTADQRGLARKSGAQVDIGAFESQSGSSSNQQLTQIVLPPQLRNQTFHFMIIGPPGTSGTIEVSSDLNSWIALTNFTTSAEGSSEFADPASAVVPQRFYRLRFP